MDGESNKRFNKDIVVDYSIRPGTVVGCCEHGDEPSVSVTGRVLF